MSLSFLKQLGLTQNESDLYELLLKLGEVPIVDLLAEARLKRPTVYKSLYSLEKKGLVGKKDKQKKIHFYPVSPSKLLDIADSQFKDLERARSDLRTLMPSLTASYVLSVEKPVIRMYEGAEGAKKAYLETLGEKKEILAYVLIDENLDKPLEKFWPKYFSIRKKNNIFVRSICPNNKEGREYKKKDKDELRETKLIPLEKFPFTTEKNIVGNKVVFFAREEGKLLATIIENKEIADTERAIFELAWSEAERLDAKLPK